MNTTSYSWAGGHGLGMWRKPPIISYFTCKSCHLKLCACALSSHMVDYCGVTRKGSGYQAQVAGPRGYLGWRPTKKQAALLVAKRKRRNLRDIQKRNPRKPLSTRPLRTHKWIYWLQGRAMWQAKLPNGTTFCAPTLAEAVKRVGKNLRKHPDSFKLKGPHAQDHGRRASQHQLCPLFRMVWGGYRRGPKQGKHRFACVPADAAYTYKYLRGPKAKPAEDPGMVFHYLMAKDGPGKDAVADATSNVKPKHGKNQPADLQELDYQRLSFALRSLSKNHDPKEKEQWSKGPGKGTDHKMGLAMWVKKNMQILKESRGKGSFPIGKERRLHKIAPLTKAVRSKFQKTREYGEAMLKVRSSKLDYLKDWDEVTATLSKAAPGVPGFSSGKKSYFFRWSTRAWVDRLRRLRGHWKGLRYPPKTSVWRLTRSFPDQSAHLTKLCGNKGLCKTTLRKLCKTLGYDAPIEHLTMHTCLCLTPKIRQMMQPVLASLRTTGGSITAMKEKEIAQKLEKVRKALTKKSKFGILIPPHPSVTVAKALKLKILG